MGGSDALVALFMNVAKGKNVNKLIYIVGLVVVVLVVLGFFGLR
jgi:hypothetical protein